MSSFKFTRFSVPPAFGALARRLTTAWHALMLLLIATPLAWATVSISGLSIQTLQQLSFAQTEIEMAVGATQTQAAISQLSQGAITYRSANPTVASVDASTGGVTALAPGVASIVATQAAAAPYPVATASYTVRVPDTSGTITPRLTFANVTVGSTTLSHQLQATSDSPGAISYAVTAGRADTVLLDPSGQLWVAGVGTVDITATQAPQGAYLGAQATATFTVQSGTLGVVVTQPPPAQVRGGETFTVRYRANSLGTFEFSFWETPSDGSDVTVIAHTVRTRVDQEEVVTFRVDDAPNTTTSVVDIGVYYVPADGSGFTETLVAGNTPPATRVTVVPQPLGNLGNPIVLTLDRAIDRASVLPMVRDAAGNVLRACEQLSTTNRDVMRYVDWPDDILALGRQLGIEGLTAAWRTMAVGETLLTCGDPNVITPVRVTVLPRDPLLANFPDLTLRAGQAGVQLLPPASLNTTGAWRFDVINPAGTTVATVQNGNVLVGQTAGQAVLRATQAASGDYAAASIDASITVEASPVVITFGDVTRTWGDPPFQMPPPGSTDTVTPFTFSIVGGTNVAEVTEAGQVTLRGAGQATIQATQGTVSATALITVNKAVPQLAFRIPLDLTFSLPNCYAIPATWPALNQPGYPSTAVNPVIGAALSSNSPGQITYRSNSNVLAWPTPSAPDTYPLGSLEGSRYTDVLPTPQSAAVWVEQAESANFLAASSPALSYSYRTIWGSLGTDSRMSYACPQ
ncbi:Ig-like domain-containing protein [Hydrogenophaga sp. XSHU_21]